MRVFCNYLLDHPVMLLLVTAVLMSIVTYVCFQQTNTYWLLLPTIVPKTFITAAFLIAMD
jgi:hypothetical protein